MATISATRAAAIALAAALGGAGMATVIAQPRPAVVVAQNDHSWLTGEYTDAGVPRYYARSCGRVLNAFDAGIAAEPCAEGYLDARETKCIQAYYACVVLPRIVKAATPPR